MEEVVQSPFVPAGSRVAVVSSQYEGTGEVELGEVLQWYNCHQIGKAWGKQFEFECIFMAWANEMTQP